MPVHKSPGVIVVRATWDPEARVWVAESSDLPGLVTEAETIEALQAKIPAMIQDLLEDSSEAECVEVPVEILASLSQRVRFHGRRA
jgi:predicted RNase H-like HicB family nuclease